MRLEISSAAQFLVDLVRLNNSKTLNGEQLERFRSHVTDILLRHYTNHWFPDKPCKGSGYRCIRINGKMDPLIARAGFMMGLAVSFLRSLFPTELTMWVDPREVSYRIGENGSICILYEGMEKTNIKSGDEVTSTAPTESAPKTPEKPVQAVVAVPPPAQKAASSPPPSLPQHHQTPSQQQQVHHQHQHHQHQHHQHHHHQQHHFSPSKSVVVSSPLQQSPPMSPVTAHQQQQQAAATAMQLSSLFFMNKEAAGLVKCKESLQRGFDARQLQMDRLFVSS